MKAKITISKVRRALWKIFSGVFFYSIALFLVVMLLLQLRPVQTFLAQKVLELISDKTNHEISLARVRVSWLDQANLEEILVRDLKNDTLLYSHEMLINYKIWDLINGDYLNVEEIKANQLRLKLTKHDSTSQLNLSEFLNALKKDTVQKASKPIYLDQVVLSNLKLTLRDKTKTKDTSKLDFSNLDFNIPEFTLAELSLRSDTIAGDILQMRGVERNSRFTIEDFNTSFRVCNQSLSVDHLNFVTPTSHISDSLEFYYNGLDDLRYFVDSVSFILSFKDTRISKEDIKIVSGIDAIKSDISIDGFIWGTVGDFNIEETRFGFGQSYFVGGVSCFGLPDISQTFVLADLTDSHVLPGDLEPYIGVYANNLRQMGKIDFTGSFAGFAKDFVARGDFVTDQGSVHTDINLKIPADASQMSYVGNLEFKNVNVGAFFRNELVQRVNLKATINGQGINPKNANFDLKAQVTQSGLKGYVYDTVSVDGKFAQNYFEGNFSVQDPNCRLDGVARIDFRQEAENVELDMDVKSFHANNLNLTSRHISGKGKIQLEVHDLNIDDFTAELMIDSGLIALNEKQIDLDSIRFSAILEEDSSRVIKLAFPGFKSSLKGVFKISDAIKDIPIMALGYAAKLKLLEDTITTENSGKSYKLALKAEIDDISRYIDSLRLPVALGGKTLIEASFRQSKNANIGLYVKTDTLFIGKSEFHKPILEINGSKEIESSGVLTNFIFESKEQVYAGIPNTKDLLLEGVWFDDNIDVTTQISQDETVSEIRLESNIKLHQDSIILKMLPSDIKLFDDRWKFNPTNKVVITSQKASISNLEIYDSSESIALEGVYADSIPTSIMISTEDLNMNKAGLFTDVEIGGFLNGNFRIFRQNSSEGFRFDGGFLLKNLAYDAFEVGDVSGSSEWNPNNQSVYAKVEVERKDINAVQVEGYYYPLNQNDQLDFDITFDEADLKMGQPFLESNFSDIGGFANGTLKLAGSIASPNVNGTCLISNGSVTVNYLNTHYTFDGRVDFDPRNIKLSNFNLTDRKGSNAIASGSISHTSFRNFVTDITLRADNFEFLNTTSLDNSLYYGSAYGTGTIEVEGPLNDLHVNAKKFRTEPNTRFFVPISEGTSVGQEEYILFRDFTDTTQIAIEDNFNISGLTLNFDIDVTPDAYCELIFDIKTGDIIRGRGRGNLKLRLDTDGDFNMFGSLEITEGAYNFTVPNLLNKEFDVVPGSRITWYGDPYNATLDLDATYLQRASFEELKNPIDQEKASMSNKVPILVVLRISGGMLSPQIDFDLELQNESDANQTNLSAIEQIVRDDQELKRQVISLLFLKRFSPRQSFTLSGGGSVGNSVSEFLSSQVSYLVSQIDENLEVEVDLADLNNDAFNTFQLRFAYTFLNGRLKVTRGGDFGNQEDNNDNVLNDIVGDWSVEYSLTRDGRLRAKVFRISDQRILTNENQQNQETGISLRFVHSFNDITELLTMKRDEALRRKEEEEEEAEPKEQEIKSDSTSIY